MANIFIDLFNMSITTSYLVLAVVVVRLLLKKAPKWISCLLWALVGIRLVCPFSIESALSLIPSSQTVAVNDSSTGRPFTVQTGVSAVDNNINEFVDSKYYEVVTVSQNNFVDVTTVLSIIWLVGLFAMLLYGVISYLRLRKSIGVSLLLKDNIYYCDNIATPFILGFFKPKIYVPSGLSEEQVNYITLHEKAHLKRKDHLWKPLGFILLSVYWFNPIMWVAYILLCRDIESASDEKVIKNMPNIEKKGYSETLVSCSVKRRMIMACPLAFGEVGVKQRIKSVLNYKKPAFWIIIVAVLLIVIIAVCFLTNPDGNSSSIGIIGGADGPTSIIVSDSKDEREIKKVEKVGEIPKNLLGVVENNVFDGVTAFEDRVLKNETYSVKGESNSVVHNIQMLDLYGNKLASYSCKSDAAYYIKTLTATNDGGFLFVLGFEDYVNDQDVWASEKGFASRVIKCDSSGKLQFDTSFDSVDGGALSYCFETDNKYYLFGTIETPETKTQGVYSYTDIYMTILDSKGAIIKTATIGGSDFDSLNFAKMTDNRFVLSVSSQSYDGDFSNGSSDGYPVDYVINVNRKLEITQKEKKIGENYLYEKIGERNGTDIYGNDELLNNFDAGMPTAYIEYEDFYLIVSLNPTGVYENTPEYISSVWYYIETVYSGYDYNGKLLFRASIDSTPDYDARKIISEE